jgi:hypothetical protein
MADRKTSDLRAYFTTQNLGKYIRRGDTALIMIDMVGLNPAYPIWGYITQYLTTLQWRGIISRNLTSSQLGIHEINLRFDIEIPGAIFCKTAGFRKVNDNTYRSTDYHQYRRQNGFFSESKGIQQSFVTVIQYEAGSSVILSFSGKYHAHIPVDFLQINYDAFIKRLISLGSIYLTQATNPDYFNIGKGFFPFFPKSFQSMLNDANWFNDKFRKRNITANFIGGLCNDI